MQAVYVFGCSGPGAGRAIAAAIRYGYISASITLTLSMGTALLYLLARRNVRAAILNMSPMVIHPAWTISARSGDCGIARVMASHFWIGLATCLLITAIIVSLRYGRAPSTTQHFQFSIGSLLLLMLATSVAIALLQTELAGFVSLIAFVGLILIGLNPIAFFKSRFENNARIQQRHRELIRNCHDSTDDPCNVEIDSHVADRIRR